MTAAVDLAEPGGFLRTFLDLEAPLVGRLRTLAARQPRSSYLAHLLAAADQDSLAPPLRLAPVSTGRLAEVMSVPALASLLTEREVEVLGHLSHHLTNKEIAAQLSISPQTVKRHVSNLFDKLGANSRRQAVVYATALGLLPATAR